MTFLLISAFTNFIKNLTTWFQRPNFLSLSSALVSLITLGFLLSGCAAGVGIEVG